MYGKMTINRSGKMLNQTFHGVPEEIFRQADLQFNATRNNGSGSVNISWTSIDHRSYHFNSDHVTGVTFERDYS